MFVVPLGVSTSVAVEDGNGDDGFVFRFLAGGFCGEGVGLDVAVGGFSEPAVVLRPVVVGLLGICFCGSGLENVTSGGLLCLNDFLLFEVPRSFVLISQSFNSFCSFFQILSFFFHSDFG
ncbi:hypothetical protein Hanom_Chr08g00706781 [Helianthus anomalus]